MMTALAFIFGIMPMMFATGAGASSRHEIGTAIVFGMVLNAIIGTLMVPTFWFLLQTFYEKYLSRFSRFPGGSPRPSGRREPSQPEETDL